MEYEMELPTENIMHLLIPLYNIKPDRDLLNMTYFSYKIIKNEDFITKYSETMTSLAQNEVKRYMQSIPPGALFRSNETKYSLYKSFYIQENISEQTYFGKEDIVGLRNFITALRLINSGNIQVDGCFLLSDNSYRFFSLDIGNSPSNIISRFKTFQNNIYCSSKYILQHCNMKDAADLASTLRAINGTMDIPLL